MFSLRDETHGPLCMWVDLQMRVTLHTLIYFSPARIHFAIINFTTVLKKRKRKDVWAVWTLLALWCWPAIVQLSGWCCDKPWSAPLRMGIGGVLVLPWCKTGTCMEIYKPPLSEHGGPCFQCWCCSHNSKKFCLVWLFPVYLKDVNKTASVFASVW